MLVANDMEERQEIDTTTLDSGIDNITIRNSTVNITVVEDESKPTTSKQPISQENIFDQLKGNNKHIFVLSTAGKPIYTR